MIILLAYAAYSTNAAGAGETTKAVISTVTTATGRTNTIGDMTANVQSINGGTQFVITIDSLTHIIVFRDD